MTTAQDEEAIDVDITHDRGTGTIDMQTGAFLLAYFGPEVQLPLVSIIGAITGFGLLVGGAPIRLARRWFANIVWRKGAP